MVANPNVTPMEPARVLGHKDAAMTSNVYAQEIPDAPEIPAAQAEMANLFGLNGCEGAPPTASSTPRSSSGDGRADAGRDAGVAEGVALRRRSGVVSVEPALRATVERSACPKVKESS